MNTRRVLLTGSFENATDSIQGFAHVDPDLQNHFISRAGWPDEDEHCLLVLKERVNPTTLLVDVSRTPENGLLWAIQILVNEQKGGNDGFLPTDKQIQFDVSGQGTFLLFFHQDEDGSGWQLIRKVK